MKAHVKGFPKRYHTYGSEPLNQPLGLATMLKLLKLTFLISNRYIQLKKHYIILSLYYYKYFPCISIKVYIKTTLISIFFMIPRSVTRKNCKLRLGDIWSTIFCIVGAMPVISRFSLRFVRHSIACDQAFCAAAQHHLRSGVYASLLSINLS